MLSLEGVRRDHWRALVGLPESAELPEARAGQPSRAAAARRGCGNPRHGKRVKVSNEKPFVAEPEGRLGKMHASC